MSGRNKGVPNDHWECKCGVQNHLTREKCLGCDAPRPEDYDKKRVSRRKLKFSTDSRDGISQVQFQEMKSECKKCCGSKLCNKHKKIRDEYGLM